MSSKNERRTFCLEESLRNEMEIRYGNDVLRSRDAIAGAICFAPERGCIKDYGPDETVCGVKIIDSTKVVPSTQYGVYGFEKGYLVYGEEIGKIEGIDLRQKVREVGDFLFKNLKNKQQEEAEREM